MPEIPIAPRFKARLLSFNIIEDYLNPTVMLPPLYVQVNPNSMKKTYQKKIHRYSTFDALVEEHWGEELDTLACSNSTGSFIKEEIGVTNIFKTQTQSYFKFQDILDVYRNNGNTYDSTGRIIRKGSIVLSFDEGTYFGFFENLSYTEDANSPFKFTFDFTFKVEKDYTGI